MTSLAIRRHFQRWVGEPGGVVHDPRPGPVAVDVHLVPPSILGDRGWVLFTSGMSDREMPVPRTDCDCRPADRVELMIGLPGWWRLDEEALRADRWNWPIHWLRDVARYVHARPTWIGWGHTIPNGDPPEPLAPQTSFCCMIVLPPTAMPLEAHETTLPDRRRVAFYALYPLLDDEVDFKLANGADALVDRLQIAGVTDEVDPNRRTVLDTSDAADRPDRSRPTRSGSHGASSS